MRKFKRNSFIEIQMDTDFWVIGIGFEKHPYKYKYCFTVQILCFMLFIGSVR